MKSKRHDGPDTVVGVRSEDDPATSANLLALARELLAGAICRYDAAALQWTSVHESFPPLDPPREPSGPEEVGDRVQWRMLKVQADENFDHAEANLAERIHGLFDILSPPGRRACEEPTDYFVPRAVRAGGNVYVLAYSAFEFEPRTNIIAVHRETMLLELIPGE